MIKIKNILKKITDHLDILVFALLFLFTESAFQWRMDFPQLGVLNLRFSVSILLVFCGLITIFPKKVRMVLESLILIICGAYCFAQRLHYAYFDIFFSAQKIMLLGELKGVSDSVFGKIARRDIIFLLPVLLLFAYYIIRAVIDRKLKKAEPVTDGKQNCSQKKRIWIRILCGLCLLLCGVGLNRYAVAHLGVSDDWNIDERYNYDNLSNKNLAVRKFGIYEYCYRDLIKFYETLKPKDNVDVSAIDEFISEHTVKKTENEMTGIFKDKNLVLIQAESFCYYPLNEPNFDDIMPVLSHMTKEGWYFKNNYAPIYQSATADSEFITQTSNIPSIDFGPTAYTFNRNQLPMSLASLFKRNGYAANSFHSYYRVFYNRELLHEAFGFDSFNDKDSLGFEFPEDYMDGINWPSDDELMARMMDWMDGKDYDKFYNFVITAGGHMPYVSYRAEMERYYYAVMEKYSDQYTEEEMAYLAAAKMLDQSLSTLIDRLEERGELDDTVIVLYGDHYPYGMSDEELKKCLEDDYKIFKVPLLIWTNNGIEPMEIEEVTSTFDVLPTLANLFDINLDEMYYVGNDYFNGEDSIVYFYDHSWLTNDFYYDSTKNEIQLLNEEADIEDAKKIGEQVRKTYEISQQMLAADYYSTR